MGQQPDLNKYPQLTIADLATSLRPGWDFTTDWLCWPPDTFALVSIIMERTGCYRHCLIDYQWSRTPEYSRQVRFAARHWLRKTTDLVWAKSDKTVSATYFTTPFEPKETKIPENGWHFYTESIDNFKKIIGTIEKYWNGVDPETKASVDLEILRTINDVQEKGGTEMPNDEMAPYRELTKALLQLLAIADSACAGIGLLEKVASESSAPTEIVHCLANLLLTATGSLSTLPKFHGAVLPKMRTPQGGITTRSLSHHLTFHTSEVEVMWRTIPWYNHHQKSMNVIAVPFPFNISEDNFEPRSERFQSVQYFSYRATMEAGQKDAYAYLDEVVDLVWRQNEKLDQIHILVFPESSLSEDQYTHLKNKLYERLIDSSCKEENAGRLYHLPLIVAGISKESENSKLSNQPHTYYDGVTDHPSHNEVRMATFFAGKWYDVAQRKHHRWHLNRNQLVQYWLAGKLPSERRWFEHISVAQRRLTILAPTGWLALTALICEDLAQLEPVSAIIRGIGPTFLMALLSDGPQLNSRWSARYANVLADDPGTAVLSLTSLGMVKRSKRLTNDLYIDQSQGEPASYTVALWKDMLRGQQEIHLTNGNQAVRFTLSAKYKEEYTLDGRSDGTNAAVFELEGYEQLPLQIAAQSTSAKPAKNPRSQKKPAPLEGTWLDIRELTALQFTLNSLVELRGRNCDEICSWLKAEPPSPGSYTPAIKTVLQQMSGALKNPKRFGIDAMQGGDNGSWPSEDISAIYAELLIFFSPEECNRFSEISDVEYYQCLFEKTKEKLKFNDANFNKSQPDRRPQIAIANRKFYLVPFAVMHLLHAKISKWQLESVNIATNTDIKDIVNLRRDIKYHMMKYQSVNFV